MLRISTGTDAAKRDYWQLAVNKLQEENKSMADDITEVPQGVVAAGNKDFAKQLLEAIEQSQRELFAT
jgi:hypothetical protein